MNEKKIKKTPKTPKVGKFPCPYCDAICLNPQSLKSHITWKHKRDELEAGVEAEKQSTVVAPEPTETIEQEPAIVAEVPEKVTAVQKEPIASTKEPEPVAELPAAGFDLSMVEPLLRQTGFAKEITGEIGAVKENIKDMATAVAGMANQMKGHAAVFQQIDGYLKQLQGGGAPNPEVSNPDGTAPEAANPESVIQETPNPDGTVAAQIPASGSIVGSSYIPLIDRLLQAMNIAKSAPTQNNPQDNFVKQFLDATTLVSTMRKATIEEMQAMFTSMASFFKNAPKFLGTGETEKATTEAPKPIAHLED